MITFGGYPVEYRTIGDECFVSCKGVVGTMSQLERWLDNHLSDPYTKFYFGRGDKLSEIVRDGDDVKIACLRENYSKFVTKLTKFIHEYNNSSTAK